MFTAVATKTPRPTRFAWTIVPLALLVGAAVLANLGASVTPAATAATSAVNVSATVASNVTLNATAPCGGTTDTIAISVAQGGFAAGSCVVEYGASNNASLPLSVADSTGAAPFLSGTVFANTAVACDTAMTGDAVGFKVADNADLNAAANNTCGTPTAAGTNLDYQAVPVSATTVCTTVATGPHTCPIAIGIVETGGDATAGTYSGILNLAA